MNLEEKLRRARVEQEVDLSRLNRKVLDALSEQRRHSVLWHELASVLLRAPIITLSTASLLVLLPLYGVLSAWGLAEPASSFIIKQLIR